MVGMSVGIKYDKAVSRIAYVGSTGNLQKRLHGHHYRSHNHSIEFLKVLYPSGLLITWIALPGLSKEWQLAIEDATLQEAFRQLGSYPICNEGPIDSPHVLSCEGLVRVCPCDELLAPRSIEYLRKQLGSTTLGKLAAPKSAEEWKEIQRGKSGATLVFTSVSPNAAPRAEPPPTLRQQQHDDQLFDWITTDHVATWNLQKMREIIEVCAALKVVQKKGKTKATVLTFEAPHRQPPLPHTWGEVALVQARLCTGQWNPPGRVIVKIQNCKTLLGQAIFDKGYFDAHDKSDLPQTRDRPSNYDCMASCEQANAVQGELPANFVPPPDEIDDLVMIDTNDPAYAEQMRLLTAAREKDVAWAKESAIERDKWRRVYEATLSQIEATFLEATH